MAAHNISRADYDRIIEHEVVMLSTRDKEGYTEIVLDDYCTQRWGVDYTADLLMADVEAGADAVKLAKCWHDAISAVVRPIFNDIDASGWRGDDGGRGSDADGWAAA